MLSFKMKAGLVAVGTAMSLGTAAPANAAAILGLYNTGVDNSGNVLAPGAAEQHYVITGSSNAALVIPNTPTVATHPSWSVNNAAGAAGSSWISPFTDANGVATKSTSFPTQFTYDYSLTFSLGSLSASSAVISGLVQSDNFVTVLLNGVALVAQPQDPVFPGGLPTSYFRKFSAFGTNGGFVSGTNTLTFQVTDYGVISGLRVSDLVGTAVPEPATWAMLIVGFGLVAGQIRRRRRAGTLAIA
jgi:hypothetical protein